MSLFWFTVVKVYKIYSRQQSSKRLSTHKAEQEESTGEQTEGRREVGEVTWFSL